MNMKVLITGGTGFVGSHVVKAVREQGHVPRVLARRPESAREALAPLGCADVDVAQGDVTDAESVRRALEGCDAVVHGGSVFSFDPRRRADIRRTNVRGTEIVLEAAHAAGCDPIVHVSSIVAMLPADGPLTTDSPPKDSGLVYAQSKTDSERIARRLQALGAPVAIVYPGWVWGPADQRFSDAAQMVTDLLRGTMRVAPPGRSPIVDVRDLATVLARLLERGRGPRRHLVAGTVVDFRDLLAGLEEITGRKMRVAVMPPSFAGPVLLVGKCADFARKLGLRLPANHEGAWTFMRGPRVDDRSTWTELGIEPRPLKITMADQIRWLFDAGHLTRAHAGRAAAAPAE